MSLYTSSSVLQAVAWTVVYSIAAACADLVLRLSIDSGLDPVYMFFWRTVMPLSLLLPLLYAEKRRASTTKEHLSATLFPPKGYRLWYAGMGFCAVLSTVSFYKALEYLSLPLIGALTFISTLLTVCCASFLYREGWHISRLLTIAVGFMGALLIIRPGWQPMNIGIAYSLINSIAWTGFVLLSKRVSHIHTATQVTAWPMWFMLPPGIVASIFFWQTPTLAQIAFILAHAFCIILVFWTKAKAFAKAPLGVLIPLDFVYLVAMAVFGALFFAEHLHPLSLVGVVIILASTWLLVRRESRRHSASEADIAQG